MKKFVTMSAIAFMLSACGFDAKIANITRVASQQSITCYSGGQVVFTDISTGKTEEGTNGIYYLSAKNNKFKQVYMDCLVEDM